MKRITAIILAFFMLSLAGCGKTIYPDITEQSVAFETGEFIDEKDDNAGYLRNR